MPKKYKGIDFLIKVEISNTEKIIGGQRGCTLNRSSDTLDVTSKDSEGWQENLSGLKNWGVDTDGLIVKDDEALDYLEECFMNGTEVPVVVATPLGKKYKGNVIITDFPLEAPYDDAATYSVSFTGSGKLESVSDTTPANINEIGGNENE